MKGSENIKTDTTHNMLRLNCFIKVNGENRAEVVRAAKALVEASRKEEGCLAYDLFESATIPEHLMICETWRDQDTLDAHSASAHFAQHVGTMRSLAEMHLDKMELPRP